MRTRPINDGDLARIEKATVLSLPVPNATLLLNFPTELQAILKLDPADSRPLFSDARTIVRWNKFFRAPDYEYENSFGEMCKFPENHIVIGANLGGDFYHINAKHKRTSVLFWCHEDGEITKCAKNLDTFVRNIFSSAASLALDGIDVS